MKYVAALLENEKFRLQLEQIEAMERERVYCRHNFAHFMDVARLAVIKNQTETMGFDEEQLYLAALLHDIGRAQEYQNGISHAAAGAQLAGEILVHLGYSSEKTAEIVAAIEGHRSGSEVENALGKLLKEVDKKSRACFLCQARSSCKWNEAVKNKTTDWK